jgi:hypothetical protein
MWGRGLPPPVAAEAAQGEPAEGRPLRGQAVRAGRRQTAAQVGLVHMH